MPTLTQHSYKEDNKSFNFEENKGLQSLIVPSSKKEKQLLTIDMTEQQRCTSPLTVAHGKLLDGYTRVEIMKSLPDIDWRYEVNDISDQMPNDTDNDKATLSQRMKLWMLTNQLSRRNLQEEDASVVRGKLVALRKALGLLALRGYQKESKQTFKQLSEEVGASPRQLHRDVAVEEAKVAIRTLVGLPEDWSFEKHISKKTGIIGADYVTFANNPEKHKQLRKEADAVYAKEDLPDFSRHGQLNKLVSNYLIDSAVPRHVEQDEKRKAAKKAKAAKEAEAASAQASATIKPAPVETTEDILNGYTEDMNKFIGSTLTPLVNSTIIEGAFTELDANPENANLTSAIGSFKDRLVELQDMLTKVLTQTNGLKTRQTM